MRLRSIPYLKVFLHVFCLTPFVLLVLKFRQGSLGADPVSTLTHATGDWALWILLLSLAITPVRRLHARLSSLIRVRRMLGLYAFFYATLHLATYVFLFSGYDLRAALGGLRSGHPGEVVSQWRLIWPSVLSDLLKRRFIQVGLVSWVVLLALTVTSPSYVLRKMGGKNWATLHRLVYVAAIAASVHYWWLVKAGVRAPLPDTLILATLLAMRLAWPYLKRDRRRLV